MGVMGGWPSEGTTVNARDLEDKTVTDERPRILLLGKLPPPTVGPSIATQILLRSDLRKRYELVHVDTNVHRTLRTLGSPTLRTVFEHVKVILRFDQALRRQRPRLAVVPISQTLMGFLKDSVFVLLARLHGCSVILHLRGSRFREMVEEQGAVGRAIIRKLLAMASAVIVLGRNLRPLFDGWFPTDRVFAVPNGLDLELPDRNADPSNRCMRILYLGNLQPSKGIEDVVTAVSLLREQGARGFHLDVVGAWRDAETRERCVAIARNKDLPVTFHGPANGPAKLQFLANADALVFTPRAPEGHPWVVVEALAAGLPIVATDRGAIVESVRDGWNGYIVEAEAPEQIADRLRPLIEDADLRARFAAASRSHYLAGFTEKRMVDGLSEVFDTLLADTRMRS